MPRRAAAEGRFSISCTESEWERIREAAERRGVSINDLLVSAALTADLGPEPAGDEPALALSEVEQRRLLERVDRLAETMLAEASGGTIERLRASVALLLRAALETMIREGGPERLRPALGAVFGEEATPHLERQFVAWLARRPPSEG